ncbi:MAG: TonB family protein [Bacteroidia bacterium]|nr:TonB family protein [Bacteroidia bacterium]
MASNNDLFSREWCNLVFDPKYREYGGYELRTNSPRRLFKALLISGLLFILIVSAPLLIKQIFPKKAAKDTTVRVLTDIRLDKNSIKFVTPVVKPDEQIAEEQPLTQKELLQEKTSIGTVNFDKGTDDISAPAAAAENNKIAEVSDVPLVSVDQMPQFPGGEKEMMRFIKLNLHYPPVAQENNIQGTVIMNFVVDREGKITNIKVIKGIGFGCDEESIRVLGRMPLWSPGKQRGQTVLVSFTMPIRFVLN